MGVSIKLNKVIKVNISQQRLCLVEDSRVLKAYHISTSKFGIGNKAGSNKTPLGLHRVCGKFGRNAGPGAIFKKRRNTGKIVRIGEAEDLITTRILRLEGLERGVNKGRGIDSFKRCIYIHGTPQEKLIGRPASHGCIRMRNKDIIKLFNLISRNTAVLIEK